MRVSDVRSALEETMIQGYVMYLEDRRKMEAGEDVPLEQTWTRANAIMAACKTVGRRLNIELRDASYFRQQGLREIEKKYR